MSDPSAPIEPPTSRRRRSLPKIVFDIALIAVGVFLGLAADQWQENRGHRADARAALQRFHTEFTTNRDAVRGVQPVHVAALQRIGAWLSASPADRAGLPYPFEGTSPAFMEYAAWDVAMATQSLAHIDQDLAVEIAHVYQVQRQLDNSTRSITEVLYLPMQDDPAPRLRAFAVYFGDCALIEPRLVALYDAILPKLTRALGRTG